MTRVIRIVLKGSIIFSTDGKISTSAIFDIMVYKKEDEKGSSLGAAHQNHE